MRLKSGFTLLEMLVVIAIIAVLIAIAVPVFSGQLNRAKIEADNANLRSAQAVATAMFVSGEHATTQRTNNWFYGGAEKYYGYYYDLSNGTCVCDGGNTIAGHPTSASYLDGHGYGLTPSLRKKSGGSSWSHVNQFIYVAISIDGSKMAAGWTYHGFNCTYVDVLPGTFMNPDDYVL